MIVIIDRQIFCHEKGQLWIFKVHVAVFVNIGEQVAVEFQSFIGKYAGRPDFFSVIIEVIEMIVHGGVSGSAGL